MAVQKIDDAGFKEQLSSNEKVVVKYYADWCGSCKLFAPKFRRLSEDEQNQGVTFLDVNAEISPEARKMGSVNNLPTVAVFKNGELVESAATSKPEYVQEMIAKLN